MKRTIIVPATLPDAAIGELKEWLAIATPATDATLAALLRAALDMAEAFTGQMPLAATCEEIVPAARQWHTLTTGPVQAIVSVERVAGDGTRTALPASDYSIDIDPGGDGRVRIGQVVAGRGPVAVRFVAGIARDWAALPDPIRQGAIRLAAHYWHERESGSDGPPPAAVAALWRPWRAMRLA